ncbi:MAG: hypothetical protein LQ341_003209 [Variospora aurantia]|nr:MAG: hypothetical protein LQ341_003209 [Variospora aurantia]
MSSDTRSATLPDVLFSSWRLRPEDVEEANTRGDLKGWTVSSFCSAYLEYQLQRCEGDLTTKNQASLPSLVSLSIGGILEALKITTDLQADIKLIAENLEFATLQRILQDPRTPYHLLRLFEALPFSTVQGKRNSRTLTDIDEMVLASEQYVRSIRKKPDYGFLVTLDSLSSFLGPPKADGFMRLKRKIPPKGGFEFLDQKRKRILRVRGTNACFIRAFDRLTGDILKGLKWDHVFMAGGMVLNTLLYIDGDPDRDVKDCDIDLYLYDLEPEEANRKVEEIYQIWSTNLPSDDADASNAESTIPKHRVVKNVRTINFIPAYPNRRIQIILKLLPSPLDILLNFDLDVCAVGFDGSQVLMLPRCARALETGYSTFTMDLIWGHHLDPRQKTQEVRVFKYADRGFGLRILPSYVHSLEKDHFGDTTLSQRFSPVLRDTKVRNDCKGPTRVFEGEPGLKTLRRITHLAQALVRRRYFGRSWALEHEPNVSRRRESIDKDETDEEVSDEDMVSASKPDEDRIGKAEPEDQGLARGESWETRQDWSPPAIVLANMEGYSTYSELTDGPRSLVVFEALMRHCEAWRLDAVGLARLDRVANSDLMYGDSNGHSPLPTYEWSDASPGNMSEYELKLNSYNDRLFTTLRLLVGQRLNINPRHGSYVGYLTRRIRCVVVDHALKPVQGKQITMPLLIPMDLQNFIENDLSNRYDDATNDGLKKLLMPAHDPSKYHPTTVSMPSLPDTADERGNLRYLLITNNNMWAGQNRVLSEVTELLLALTEWFQHMDFLRSHLTDAHSAWIMHLLKSFRRRLVLPETSEMTERGQTLPLRETRLFRAWALTPPPPAEQATVEHDVRMKAFKHDLARPDDVPDHLFWRNGDEGAWYDEEGVPAWRAWRVQ